MCPIPTYIWLIWKDEEKIITRETYENAYVYDHFFSSIHHYLFLLFCSSSNIFCSSDTIWNSKMKMFGGWPKKRQVFIVNLNFLFVLSIQQYHIFFCFVFVICRCSIVVAPISFAFFYHHFRSFVLFIINVSMSLFALGPLFGYFGCMDVWLGMQPISIHHQLLFFIYLG